MSLTFDVSSEPHDLELPAEAWSPMADPSIVPDAAAVVGDGRVTYAELEGRSARLAGALRALGVGAEVHVAVCLPVRAQALVASLAVWKAGGACLPLDPAAAPDAVARALEDASVPLLLTDAALAASLPAGAWRVLTMDVLTMDALEADATEGRPRIPALRIEPGTDDAGAYAAPRAPLEEVLAAVWADVLRVERVGVHDSFFELGGNSLLATRVTSRIREVLGLELPLRDLFDAPTVAGLAQRVGGLRAAELPPIVPADRAAPLPLSFAQERLWFLDRLQPGGAFFNVPVALRLEGALDVRALERALGEVVRRHEALRTTVREEDGAPVQGVAPFAGFVLPVEDLSAMGASAREDEANRRAADEAARPFDLVAGPLFRARLLRLGDTEHVLLISLHQLVTDGWSLDVLFRELAALYGAFRRGAPSPLAHPPVQYADYAAWQRAQLAGDGLERALAWWKDRLAGAPELLQVPTDHPRPAMMSFRGARVPVRFSRDLLTRLEALARAEGATLHMVLLGAFQVLLARYSGSEDVVVGGTVAGRARGETEGLIGLFMNTLVLRTDLTGDPSFADVVRRVREVTLGAHENQDVPFERLVDALRPERNLSHSPLFQVLFELNTAGAAGPVLPGVDTRAMETEGGTARVDLALSLGTSPRGLTGSLTFATDLFEAGTARRMVEQLERVLEQVAGDPEKRISRLALMGRSERRRVLEWNRVTARFPADRCIHHLFEAQAARTPDAVAVAYGAETLTYAELDARANRLARHLVRLGVGPEVRVGLCLERSLEIMVCILAVMKAGGAYVPLDPAHPAERQAYMLEDSGAAVLLTQERMLRGRLPARPGMQVVAVDAEWGRIAAEPADAPETGVTPENLAYVIYTSGSTGRPKGVAMHHRGVCNYVHWGVRAYGAEGGSGAPVFSSMAVDLTITNLLPLFAGRTVRLLPEENAVEALADALRGKPGFGLIKITPVHLSLLTPLLTADEARAAAQTLVVGADFLSAEPTLFWQDHAPGVRLMNEYGPTETVVGCSAYVLPPGKHRAGPVPVGHPIQNLRFYVLDGQMEPVPVGVPGELYIAGAGVARGYLGRASLTAGTFVPDPFAGSGERMYRTGDRARWQADGNLMILGRTDTQVKIRGYRVELGEIESVLRRHDAVRACVVIVREDRPGDRRLVAYVAGDADTATLRTHLRERLPDYMVPDAFVRLDALPATAAGKVDPRTLPAPDYRVHGGREEPRNAVEAALVHLWEDLLGVGGISPTRDFFELGGNSLLALRLSTLVNRSLECDLPLATLYAGATVRQMANAILAQRDLAKG